MEELIIKTHDFEAAKLEIKEFSEQTDINLDLKPVNEKKDLAEWFSEVFLSGELGVNHKVTGEELNNLIVQLQSRFKSQNDTQIKLIKQFGKVYDALEALDRDYIRAIIVSVKANEATGKRIEATQGQIKKIVEEQKRTIGVLKEFKKKLDSYIHLCDIDKLWSECQDLSNRIKPLSKAASKAVLIGQENTETMAVIQKTLEDTDSEVTRLSGSLGEQIPRIEGLVAFVDDLKELSHLKDVDEIWTHLEDARGCLKGLRDELEAAKQTVEKQNADLSRALRFVETAAEYKHLKDIDAIWDKVEENDKRLAFLTGQSEETNMVAKENQAAIENLTEYRQELSAVVHLQDVDCLWTSTEEHSRKIGELQRQNEEVKKLIEQNKVLVEEAFDTEKEKNCSALQQLNRKIQYAYWLAGGSVALAVIELLVILLR